MKKILTIIVGAMFLSGCSTLSQKQDSTSSLEQNKRAADSSFEQRMKLARKPYAFLAVDYMNVAEGKEELYLEVEAAWEKIHQKMAAEGKILSWGLAKARDNKFGYEYITWKLLRSRGALDNLYDMEAIKQRMGEDKFEELMAKTTDSREISASELMALEDYTLLPLSESNHQVDPKNLFVTYGLHDSGRGQGAGICRNGKKCFPTETPEEFRAQPKFSVLAFLPQNITFG